MKEAIRYAGIVVAVCVLGGGAIAAEKVAVKEAAKAPAAGGTKGTFTVKGKTFSLVNATAFVDQKEEGKPTVLLLTDEPVSVTGWTSGSDLRSYRREAPHKFSGLVFWLDSKGVVFRNDYYDATPFATGSSGYFDVTLSGPMGKTLAGTVKSTAAAAKGSDQISAEVTFSTTVK